MKTGLSAGNVETNGKTWLDAHGEAAAVNVNGEWHEKERAEAAKRASMPGIVSVNKISGN